MRSAQKDRGAHLTMSAGVVSTVYGWHLRLWPHFGHPNVYFSRLERGTGVRTCGSIPADWRATPQVGQVVVAYPFFFLGFCLPPSLVALFFARRRVRASIGLVADIGWSTLARVLGIGPDDRGWVSSGIPSHQLGILGGQQDLSPEEAEASNLVEPLGVLDG